MRIKLFGSWRLSLVAFNLLAIVIASGDQLSAQPVQLGPSRPPVTSGTVPSLLQDKHYLQWKSFYDQRAYPLDRIPPGAYQKARQDYDQKWGAANLQPGAAAINVNSWTSIGPAPIVQPGWSIYFGQFNQSGRVTTIAVHPTDPNTIYIGGAQGGVWKTTNGGTTWSALTDNQCSLAMGSIAIDPVNPNIIYAGTGEENFSLGNSYYGCGVLRSTDGGATWTQLGASVFQTTSGGATISKVLVDAASAGSATSTWVLAATEFGVYRSTDSGTTWTRVLSGVATDLVADPSDPNILYAAIGCPYSSCSQNNGVYKSTNGGASFSLVGGVSSLGRLSLAIAPSSPLTLYIAAQNLSDFTLGSIWVSTDGGQTYSQVAATGASCTSAGGQCNYDMFIAVDPTNVNTVYFGGYSLYKSTDGGASFFNIGGNAQKATIHVDQHAFSFQPGAPNTIYVGNDGGVYKSTNGGITWTTLNTNLALTQFYPGVSLHPTNASVAFGGTQDNGSVYYSGSSSWTSLPRWGDSGFTAIDFNTPTTAYSEQVYGPYRQDNFPSSSPNDWVAKTSGINLSDRHMFVRIPIVMNPTDSQALYYGTFRIYETTNRGDSWSVISPDLTKGNCGFGSSCSVSTIAEAKSNAQVFYVGTSDGNVAVTANGGTNWTLVTTGLPNRAVTYVAVDPTNSQNAFVVFSGFSSVTPSTPGHVFKTTNGGASWSNISGNLPDIPVNAIALDPTAPTTKIFIGTDLGVFQTSDGGASWTAFNNGFPNVAVMDLVYNQTTGVLLAATYGRGAWKATIGSGSQTATHDFNGDGKADILWRNQATGQDAVWLMNGTAVSSGVLIPAVPDANWKVVGVADFNGDGRADILWRHAATGQNAIWLMNGASVASGVLINPVADLNWKVMGVGDFNADGKADILWRHAGSGQNAIWLMNGASVASGVLINPVPDLNWQMVGVADFSGDGKADILWRHATTGQNAIWLMNGASVASGVLINPVPDLNWKVMGVGDFNADGKADILWRHAGSGQNAIWLMNGASVASGVLINPVPDLNWQMVGVADFSGDGKADILWRHATTGQNAIWLMNGASVASGVLINPVPDLNWQVAY